jgi:LacI family transcriptional regulator, galactose operon repressor
MTIAMTRPQPPHRSATQRDVARAAGVHRATVSRALDPHRRALLDPATVTRVIAAAEGLGYRPNALARGLKTSRSFVIGLVVPDLSSPTYAPIIGAVESALRERGYTALVASTGDEYDALVSVAESLAASRVDGIVLATARSPEFALRSLHALPTPVVVLGGTPQDEASLSISIDHRLGVEIAVKHLIRLGHTRIGLIAERRNSSLGAAPHEGYEHALRQAGLAFDPGLVELCEPTRAAAGVEACSALFYRGASPTAIVATNDGAALGCYSALAEFGLKVPDDVSVVGYGNTPYGRYFTPPLTTIALPLSAMGTTAAAQILRLVEPGDHPAGNARVELRPYLLQRLSSGPPRGGRDLGVERPPLA